MNSDAFVRGGVPAPGAVRSVLAALTRLVNIDTPRNQVGVIVVVLFVVIITLLRIIIKNRLFFSAWCVGYR